MGPAPTHCPAPPPPVWWTSFGRARGRGCARTCDRKRAQERAQSSARAGCRAHSGRGVTVLLVAGCAAQGEPNKATDTTAWRFGLQAASALSLYPTSFRSAAHTASLNLRISGAVNRHDAPSRSRRRTVSDQKSARTSHVTNLRLLRRRGLSDLVATSTRSTSQGTQPSPSTIHIIHSPFIVFALP